MFGIYCWTIWTCSSALASPSFSSVWGYSVTLAALLILLSLLSDLSLLDADPLLLSALLPFLDYLSLDLISLLTFDVTTICGPCGALSSSKLFLIEYESIPILNPVLIGSLSFTFLLKISTAGVTASSRLYKKIDLMSFFYCISKNSYIEFHKLKTTLTFVSFPSAAIYLLFSLLSSYFS